MVKVSHQQNPRAWNEDVDLPKAFHCFRDHLSNGRHTSCIAFDNWSPVVTDLFDYLVSGTGVGGIVDYYIGTILGENERSSSPDTLRAASDQSCLSNKL